MASVIGWLLALVPGSVGPHALVEKVSEIVKFSSHLLNGHEFIQCPGHSFFMALFHHSWCLSHHLNEVVTGRLMKPNLSSPAASIS